MNPDESETLGRQKAETQTKKVAPNWLIRFLWMGSRVAEARAKSFGPSKPGYAWYLLARQFADDVLRIGENRKGSWAVLLLDCAAIGFLIRAHLAREGFPSDATPLDEADWDKVRRVAVLAEAWGELSPAQLSTLKAMLGPEREARLARLTGREREAFAAAVHRLVRALSAPLDRDANRLGFALLARWTRVTLTGLVLLAGLGIAGGWIAAKFAKPNLALHRPVTMSSMFPWEGRDPSKLVDGDREKNGFHTNNDGQQWVVIDLGAVRKFDKVVVYNRSEYPERAVPLRLEVSKDNQNYTLLRERKEIFDKWTAKGLHAEGRYLRLKNTPPNYFHLAEVEIY